MKNISTEVNLRARGQQRTDRSPTIEDLRVDTVNLSVVIPVYRSADCLPLLVSQLVQVLQGTGRDFEIILVDDGSPDHSWEVLCELHAAYPKHVLVIQLMRNFGQHNALMCGLRHARGQVVVTMDDDLQHAPQDIPRLVEALEAGALDLAYGCYERKKHRAWRNVSSRLVNVFFRRVLQTHVVPTSFRAMRRELVESILSYTLNFTYIDGLLAWNTQRVGAVMVTHQERFAGLSGYSLGKLIRLSLNLFTNFSLWPLQLVSACGFLAAGSGLGLGCYYLIYSLLRELPVPGYASTIVAVLILGGIQLLSLGVMGEYLGRIHLNINRKPQYVERYVREVVSGGSPGYPGMPNVPSAGSTQSQALPMEKACQ